MKFCDYETHEGADIMPLMEPDEFAELKSDIQRHGLLEPLVVFQGKILDGRNRARACEELGIKPRTVLWFEGGMPSACGGSPIEWVLSKNLKRRHLTPSQRASIALQSLPLLEAEAKERQRLAAEATNTGEPLREIFPQAEKGKAVEKAAKAAGVNSRYIQDAKKIKEESPETFEKLKTGEVTLQDAKRRLFETVAIPKPAEDHPDDDDSPKLWALKQNWKHATKKDRRNFLEWVKSADDPQRKQKPIQVEPTGRAA